MFRYILAICVIPFCIPACATPPVRETASTYPAVITDNVPRVEEVSQKSSFSDVFRGAELRILQEGAGERDGKLLIGTSAAFQLVLTFPASLPKAYTPARFAARIGTLPFPFSIENAHREYISEVFSITEPDQNIKAVKVQLYFEYGIRQNKISQNNPKWVVVDTQPPPKPDTIRIIRCERESFTVQWNKDITGDINEYAIRKNGSEKVDRGHRIDATEEECSINLEPKGSFYVTAVDKAENESDKVRIHLPEDCLLKNCENEPLERFLTVNGRSIVLKSASNCSNATQILFDSFQNMLPQYRKEGFINDYNYTFEFNLPLRIENNTVLAANNSYIKAADGFVITFFNPDPYSGCPDEGVDKVYKKFRLNGDDINEEIRTKICIPAVRCFFEAWKHSIRNRH